jgi:endoglucanase
MNESAVEFLKQLVATATPSGFEHGGQKLVADYMRGYADEVRRDAYGNTIGVINPENGFRVMLAGHCDEIGLMVQFIDEKGFLYVSAVGGVNVRLLQGERVIFQGRRRPVPGVIGVKPVHVMTQKERESGVPKIHELWVDIGARSRADAEKVIAPGDVGTVDAGWIDLRGGLVACRAFDDRIGAFIVADVLRRLAGRKLKVGVYAVSTVQEEIGLRGARMAAFGLDPSIGLVAEVGHATDFPDGNSKLLGEARLGGGPIVRRGPTYHPWVVERLEKTAARLKMKVQSQPEARGANTDAYALQISRAGIPTGIVSVPTRYMHSPVETICLKDADKAASLLAEFIVSLRGAEKFGG